MLWNNFETDEFIFEGHKASVVKPEIKNYNPVFVLKTEYRDAFPETEIEFLNRGFFVAFIENDNRWGTDRDLDRKARFVNFVSEKYGLHKKCIPVGMSCGGLIAIKFAAKYPELISCLYIDAPVLNYMSCPCGFGIGERIDDENFTEILTALDMKSISELICYRETPQDKIPDLIENRIPVVMVAGDSDTVVPYVENGILIEKAYREASLPIDIFIKRGCNHHPHGLENPSVTVDSILNKICDFH
ncbi:MAG: alpha/beta hydrolase [Clostridia bacterium]|nr:alpha/beta hydrolase [Clostridia bacterium]